MARPHRPKVATHAIYTKLHILLLVPVIFSRLIYQTLVMRILGYNSFHTIIRTFMALEKTVKSTSQLRLPIGLVNVLARGETKGCQYAARRFMSLALHLVITECGPPQCWIICVISYVNILALHASFPPSLISLLQRNQAIHTVTCKKSVDFVEYWAATDESTDVVDIAQLAVLIVVVSLQERLMAHKFFVDWRLLSQIWITLGGKRLDSLTTGLWLRYEVSAAV